MSSNATLINHCGATPVSRDDLGLIVASPPAETWYSVSHQEVLSCVEETLASSGSLKWVRTRWKPNDPPGKPAGFGCRGKGGVCRCRFCSMKPKDSRGKPVGFFASAVVLKQHEIPLARPAVHSVSRYLDRTKLANNPAGLPSGSFGF